LENLIELQDGSFRWIDFQQSDLSPAMVQRDLEELTKSMLNDPVLPVGLNEKIRVYSCTDMGDPHLDVCRAAITKALTDAIVMGGGF
jgi:hypothetical protein